MSLPEIVQEFIQAHGINIYRWGRICFKCRNTIPIYSYYLYCDLSSIDGRLGDYFRGRHGIGLGDIPSIDEYLANEINSIQIRYSKTINDSYVANTCMHCGAMQGYYYVVIDPHEIHHDLMHAYRMKKYIFKTLYPYDVRIPLNDLQNIFINNQ